MLKRWGGGILLVVIFLAFTLPAAAEKSRYTQKDWEDLSRAINKAIEICAQKNFKCFEKCRQQYQGGGNAYLRCNRKCGEKFDACVEPENQKNIQYKLVNERALAQLEEDTDTCHENYTEASSRCAEIDPQAQAARWEKCHQTTSRGFRSCLNGAMKRFHKKERWPALKTSTD